MHIHLVRHAHAGSRSDWHGDDRDRPLSDKGRAQAAAIAEDLAAAGVDELWSSPYVRCVETLTPLAGRLGVAVQERSLLAEGAWGTDALDALLLAAKEGLTVVASSHGDVIPEVLRAAVRRGADLDGPTAPRKGGRYDLVVEDGAVIRITYTERPDVGG